MHWAAVGGHSDIINYVYNEFQLLLDEEDEVKPANHILKKIKNVIIDFFHVDWMDSIDDCKFGWSLSNC